MAMDSFLEFNGKKYCHMANSAPLFCIAGPCVIESRQHALEVAAAAKEIFAKAGLPLIFKSSFDKANRSSRKSFRGPGFGEGLQILADIRESLNLPVLTDIHLPDQARPVAEVVDFLQIPAFLCRQTDLIEAAARAGNALNIKKGQFLAPWEMANVLDKAIAARKSAANMANAPICLCERGNSFGYGNLVVDMRNFDIMKQTGAPVVFDATHSVQLPGACGSSSGGQRQFVATLAKAAVATGIAGLFMEIHPDPDKAPCDGPNMLALSSLPPLLSIIKKIDYITKNEQKAD